MGAEEQIAALSAVVPGKVTVTTRTGGDGREILLVSFDVPQPAESSVDVDEIKLILALTQDFPEVVPLISVRKMKLPTELIVKMIQFMNERAKKLPHDTMLVSIYDMVSRLFDTILLTVMKYFEPYPVVTANGLTSRRYALVQGEKEEQRPEEESDGDGAEEEEEEETVEEEMSLAFIDEPDPADKYMHVREKIKSVTPSQRTPINIIQDALRKGKQEKSAKAFCSQAVWKGNVTKRFTFNDCDRFQAVMRNIPKSAQLYLSLMRLARRFTPNRYSLDYPLDPETWEDGNYIAFTLYFYPTNQAGVGKLDAFLKYIKQQQFQSKPGLPIQFIINTSNGVLRVRVDPADEFIGDYVLSAAGTALTFQEYDFDKLEDKLNTLIRKEMHKLYENGHGDTIIPAQERRAPPEVFYSELPEPMNLIPFCSTDSPSVPLLPSLVNLLNEGFVEILVNLNKPQREEEEETNEEEEENQEFIAFDSTSGRYIDFVLQNPTPFPPPISCQTQNAQLQLACMKCKCINVTMVNVQDKNVKSLQCIRCGLPMKFRVEAPIFPPGAILRIIDMENCLPQELDLRFTRILGKCSKCYNVAKYRAHHVINPLSSVVAERCKFCNELLVINTERPPFFVDNDDVPVPRVGVQLDAYVSGTFAARQRRKVQKLTEGTPLPKNGTCKHYSKSYRWLRFPCCGLAYPCDICHEEEIKAHPEEPHEPRWANYTICGFCSHEFKTPPQGKLPVCPRCNATLIKVERKTTFWEGGEGCRDPTRMSRASNKKHKGESKTISRKSRMQKEKKNAKK